MRHVIRVVSVALVLVMFGAFLEGCNTVKGLGQDIEHGGKKIQEATGK